MLSPVGCFDGDLQGCPGRPQLQQGDPHQGRDLLRDGAVRAGGVGCDWSAGHNTLL